MIFKKNHSSPIFYRVTTKAFYMYLPISLWALWCHQTNNCKQAENCQKPQSCETLQLWCYTPENRRTANRRDQQNTTSVTSQTSQHRTSSLLCHKPEHRYDVKDQSAVKRHHYDVTTDPNRDQRSAEHFICWFNCSGRVETESWIQLLHTRH